MRELLSERNTALAALSEQEAERRVGAALAQGYITPGMHSWALALCREQPDHFEAFLSLSAPAYAHFLRPSGLGGKAPPHAGTSPAASPEAQAICAQLDLDPGALG